MSNKRIMAVVT